MKPNVHKPAFSIGCLGPTMAYMIIFILKLVGILSWHWVWVLSPLWIPVGLFMVYVILASLIVTIISIIED